ncbi:MAG: aminopeptidase P family protein [Clostridia bacterium]|nr:aminopeptidase P family protein [Clostridia bacterium]
MYKKLDDILKDTEAVLITSPYNMRYFSSFSGGEGFLLISKDERVLFTDSRYTEVAEKEAKDFKVIETKKSSDLTDYINNKGFKEIAIEDNFMTVSSLENLKAKTTCAYIGKGKEIDRKRIIKTPFEIEKIKKAEEIGDNAFSHILKFIKEGITENDIATELEYFMKKAGAEKTSFDTISISGKKTSMPHGVPSDKKIEKGDFITLDFGCIYEGYCSDMTRTVVLGKASEKQKEIYNIVLSAQLKGLTMIKNGVKCADADRGAREIIEKAGYGEYFGHSLGHGVGLLIHEAPTLSPNSLDILEENMVVSCEPGIYIPDFGGVRIEDLVVVNNGGCTILSKSDKNLLEI